MIFKIKKMIFHKKVIILINKKQLKENTIKLSY